MTREEAKYEIITLLEIGGSDGFNYKEREALNMAIKELEQEPYEDVISRQQAIDAIHCSIVVAGRENAEIVAKIIGEFADRIKALPTIQPERKKGEWLPDNNNAYEMRFVCSCCKESEIVPTIGFTKNRPLWDFCPNCGADMRGE